MVTTLKLTSFILGKAIDIDSRYFVAIIDDGHNIVLSGTYNILTNTIHFDDDSIEKLDNLELDEGEYAKLIESR